MWNCPNCQNQIEDQYKHCWNCGAKHSPAQTRTAQPPRVPQFAEFNNDANLPKVEWWGFRLPGVRIVIALLLMGILKILSSRFLGVYGLKIFIGVAVLSLVVILWKFFHRDTAEGVGLEL